MLRECKIWGAVGRTSVSLHVQLGQCTMRPAFGVVKACALRTHTPAQTIVIRLCNMIALAGVLNCQQVGVLGAEYVYKSLAFHSRWSTLHMHSMKGGKVCLNEQALTSMPTSGPSPVILSSLAGTSLSLE